MRGDLVECGCMNSTPAARAFPTFATIPPKNAADENPE